MKADDPLFMDPEDGLERLTAPPKDGKKPGITRFPAPKIGIVILFLILVVALFIYRPSFSRTAGKQANATSTATKVQPIETDQGIVTDLKIGQQALVTINKSQWIGASCYDPNGALVAEILTPGVLWRVRLDGDDKLQSGLDPADWAKYKLLKGAEAHVRQYKIQPEDPSSSAKVTIRAMTKAEFAQLAATSSVAGRN